MATAVVTKDKLHTNPYENILAIIDNNSNVNDPRSPGGTRKFVHTSDPFSKAINFSDFPYIVLKFPELEHLEKTTNGKVKNMEWKQTIIVRVLRHGSSNNTSSVLTGKTDLLNICDDLTETFNNETIKGQLRDMWLFNMDLKKVSQDEYEVERKEVYEATFELTFDSRITVSD